MVKLEIYLLLLRALTQIYGGTMRDIYIYAIKTEETTVSSLRELPELFTLWYLPAYNSVSEECPL
jgi:hypothetical protein